MFAEPAATPLTSPFASTVVTADNCCVPPTAIVADAGLTVTDATGTTATVMAALPLLPSLVAVIVAVPAARPVTSPLVLTVATAALLLVQVTTRPVRVLPAASFVTADSCCVVPTQMLAEAGLTATDATAIAETAIE